MSTDATTCAYADCGKPVWRRLVCEMHYFRERRDGWFTFPARNKGGRPAVVMECGTEQRYQQHAHTGDTATGGRRVTCAACLAAHTKHNRGLSREVTA